MAEATIPFKKYWSASIGAESTEKVTVPSTAFIILSNVCISHFNPDNQYAGTPVRLFASCSKHSCVNDDDTISKKNRAPVLICTLVPLKCEHLSINFRLMPGEDVELAVKGPHSIDIIGYYPSPETEEEDVSNEGDFTGTPVGKSGEEEEEEEDFAESVNTSDIEKEIKKRIEKEATC